MLKRQRIAPADELRCQAVVLVAEELRRTGRGKYGFERHHTKKRCSRKAVRGGYCKQHSYKIGHPTPEKESQ